SQCWSAGFSHCEARLGKASIPLTSLDTIGDIDTIRILDVKDSVLFTIKSMIRHYDPTDEYKVKEVIKRTFETKYLLFGHDDGQDFLVELDDKPKTVKQAYESMIPLEGKTKRKILRQGDLFFIPTAENFKEYSKQHYEDLPINLTDQQKFNLDVLIERKIGNRFKNTKSYYSPTWIIKDATTRLIAQYTKLDYLKTIKPKRELLRNQIFDTNHESQFMNIVKGKVFVKGQIIHTNRQHRKLVLNQWYQVVKNRVKESYTIQRFGGMGRD